MTPIEWAIRPLKKYADFKGRAPRAEYWWFTLASIVAGFPIDMLDRALIGELGLIGLAYNLGILVPSIAVTVRRLHDTGRSGWWLLAFVIPAIAFGAYAGFMATGAALTGGEFDPTSMPLGIVSLLAIMAGAVLLFVFMLLPGTEGPNRFGDDPYGPDKLEEVFA